MAPVIWLIVFVIVIGITWIGIRRWHQAVGMRAGNVEAINQKRQSNKRLNNKFVMKVLRAGKPHSFFALAKHIGRKSGKQFIIPVRLVQRGNKFIIPLTYGDRTDWYQNLQAAGCMVLQWQGVNFQVGLPERLEVSSAINNFPLISRFLFWLDGLPAFVQVTKMS